MQPDLAAKAGRPADDHAADVVAPDIARHHAIGDQESSRPGVVGDHPVGGEIGFALLRRCVRSCACAAWMSGQSRSVR